jgi:hypothetical protein
MDGTDEDHSAIKEVEFEVSLYIQARNDKRSVFVRQVIMVNDVNIKINV